MRKMKNLALEINTAWKINVLMYPLVTSVEGIVTRTFLKYLENICVTRNNLRVGQKAVLLQTCHIERKFLGHAP